MNHDSRSNRQNGRPDTPRRAANSTQEPSRRRDSRIELPVTQDSAGEKEMVYIAYGENGDDVAFEMSEDIEEALGVYQIMKEDGFTVRMYQAIELDIVEEDE